MKKEIVIDKYGIGNAVVVLEEGKIIDCFIDPPQNAMFYPPNTFVKAKIDRRVGNIGGYFVRLPNGCQGFLKSKNKYREGNSILLLSQVIYETHKPQIFTDTLKIVSKYFVLKKRESGFSFSKKLEKGFDTDVASDILRSKLEKCCEIFIICRSSVADISLSEFEAELERNIINLQNIKTELEENLIYFNGLARKICLEKYGTKYSKITEGKGIFERIGIWDRIERIKKGNVCFNNGSYLIFEQTSAFLSIDVNSGNDFKTTNTEINLRACNEISRIIKGFGLGGKILIDFLPCSIGSRREIQNKISSFFLDDAVKKKIWGWTKSGVFEIERKRDKIPLKLLILDN